MVVCMLLLLFVSSERVEASTLEIGIETDKQEYQSGDSIQIRIDYTNGYPAALEGVQAQINTVTGAELSLESEALSAFSYFMCCNGRLCNGRLHNRCPCTG